MINIRTLKKLKSIRKIKKIDKDNIYYIDYTNYKIQLELYSNLSEIKNLLNNKYIDHIIQETIYSDLYILRVKSYR